ncbi:MAG: TolC family protein [Gammaproteobacteria bacterium]|nr:TolC family protein [Gammaproteobacteria bacterium]
MIDHIKVKALCSGVFGLVPVLIAGCATFSSDGGFDTVTAATRERVGQDVQLARPGESAAMHKQTITALLTQPLTPEAAVQIALLNNPRLQASYAELGIAEADLVQAGRLHNPSFSYARLAQGDEIEIERTLTFDVLGLFTLPIRRQIESRRFEQAKLQAAIDVLALAAETRKSYYSTIAAEQTAQYLEQAKQAAEASAELARRMVQAGNWSKLQQAREQAFYAELTAQLARARQASVSERKRLTRLFGAWGNDIAFKLPERLPKLPKEAQEIVDLESRALNERLDVQAARLETQGIAKSLGLSKATRFVNVLDLGVIRNSSNEQPRQTGYEIELSIPLFDGGGAKAEAIYLQSAYRLREIAIGARSEVRESYHGYRTAFDIAKHYRDEIVPLHKQIADENLLRYNGMLISVFELLADAREQVAAVNRYLDAQRDFWIADTDLQTALSVKSPEAMRHMTAAMPATDSGSGGH